MRPLRKAPQFRGFTLLEVVVSLAILATVLAIMGKGFQMGLNNIDTSRNELRATMIAEAIMSEIVAGARAPDNVSESAYDQDPDNWVYSVQSDTPGSVGEMGLISIQVSVVNKAELQTKRGSVTLTRWITDPTIAATEEASQAVGGLGSSASSSSSSSSSSGTSSSNNSSSGNSSSGSSNSGGVQ